jgi:hypothetical protein
LTDWVLRDEILVASHRWPLIVAFILAGSLLGWIAAALWPAHYQASLEMSVNLDPHRFAEDSYVPEFANTEFRNPDDYKHWQMSQLSVLAFSDEYLEETLNRLQEQDAAWEAFDVPALRGMLSVTWRNAGRWRLSARAEDPQKAAQLVATWRQVVLEKTGQAVAHSRQIYLLDLEQEAIQNELVGARQEIDTLTEIQSALASRVEALEASPQEEALNPEERAQLFALGARLDGPDPAWQVLVEEFPPEGAPSGEYLHWLEQLSLAAGEMSGAQQAVLQELQGEEQRVEAEWRETLQAGRGLAFTLSVALVQDSPPEISQPRPTSPVALLGGAVGLLAWGLYQLFRITASRPS